ncbi:PREDICTED: golgin subfamily A member 4-like [Branchiostoma belcheri]|uniref:Golgin subfamily A member 4-like n=1 Tax=Branchiostoma belcheri TaxID=7741 RepID=A0A6P4XVZ5_BRABE|nr:PREDICTED: golgin subfamily A member 4-like [Branchiostoma belcheri]
MYRRISGLEQTVNTLRASVGGGQEPSGIREAISQLRNRVMNLERQVQAGAGRGSGGGNFAPASALDQAVTRLERMEQALSVVQGQLGSAGGGADAGGLRQLRERITDVENNINRIRSQVVSTGSQSISTSEITDLQLKVSALDDTFRSYQPLLLKLSDVDTRLRDLETSGTQGSGPDVGTAVVSRIRTRIGRLEQGMFGRILSGYSRDPVSNKMKQQIDKNRGLIESYTTLVPEVQVLQRQMDRVQSNSNRHAKSIAELQDRTETMSQQINELDGFYRQSRLRGSFSSVRGGAVNTTELRKLRLELNALQGSVFRLLESANRMDDLEEKMSTMELTVLGAATQVTKTEVDQIRTAVGKLQDETLQWGDDWSEVQTRLADVELRVRTMKGTVDILETKSIRPPDPVPDNKLTEESARELASVTENMATVQLKVNSMENLITEYVSKVTGLDIKSSRIHEVMASQSNLIQDLDDKTRDMWDSVETARQDVIRVKRDMLTLQQKMKFQTSLVSKLNASLGNQNSAMSQLFNNMDVQNNQISDFERSLGDQKASMSQIQSSLQNSATLLSRLAEKVDSLEANQPRRGSISGAGLIPVSAQREVRDQLNPIKRTMSNHTRQLFEMRQSVDDIRRLLRSHSDEMTRLSNTEGEMSGRLAKQMTMILNLESSSQSYSKSVSKQRDSIDQLKGQVKSHDKTLGKLRQSSATQDVGIQNLQQIVNGHTIQMLNTSSMLGNHSRQLDVLKGASYKLELDIKNHSRVLGQLELRDDNMEDRMSDQALNLGRLRSNLQTLQRETYTLLLSYRTLRDLFMITHTLWCVALNLGRLRSNLQTLQRETYTHFAEYEQLASSIDNLDGSYVTKSELRKKLFEIDSVTKNQNSSILLLQRENREQFSVLDKHSLFIRDVRNLLEEKADVSNIMDIIQREARGDLMRLHNMTEAHSEEIRALQDARDQHSDGIYKAQTSLTSVGDDIRILREDLSAVEITMTSHTDSLGRLATLASTATDGRQQLNLTVLELDRKTRKHSETLQALGRIVSVLESISDNHEATIRDQDTGLTSLKVEATRTQRALQNLTKTDILLEKRVGRLRTTQIEHNAAISRLSLQTSTVETSLSEQYNTIADLKLEDVEIKDSVVQVAVALGKMNDTVIEHSRDIRGLLETSTSERSRVSNFERVLSTQIEAISSLGSSVQNYTTLNAFLSSRLRIENQLYELGNGLLYVNNTLYNYARRLQGMENEYSSSRRRLSQHNADLKELKSFETRAEKDIEDQLNMIYRIEEDLDSVDYVVNNHVNIIEELESTTGNHSSLLLGLENKARYISADIISLDSSLKKQGDAISRLTNTTTLQADNLAQATETSRKLRLSIRNNTEAIGGVGRRVQQVTQLVKSNTLKISSLEQKDSQFESDISGLDLLLSQGQRQTDELEERVRELTVDDSFLRTRQNRFAGEMFSLNNTLLRLRKDHRELEDIVSRLRTVSTVRHVIMEEQFRNITDRTAVNRQMIGGLNYSIGELDATLENQGNFIDQLKSELSAHDRRLNTNDRRIIIQGSSIEKLQSRASDLGKSFTTAGQAITDLRTDVEGTFNNLNIRTQTEFKRRDSAIGNLTQDIRNHTTELRNLQEVDRQLRQEDGRLRDLLGEYLTVINRHETGLSEQSNRISYLRTLIRTQQALTGNHTQALTRLKIRDRILENAIDEIKLVFLPNDANGLGNNLLSSASDLRNPFTQITRLEDKLDTISTSVTQQSRDITQLEEASALVKDDLYEHVAQYQKSDRRLSTAVSRLEEHVGNVRNVTREQDTKLYQLESLGEMLESVLNDNINTVSDIQTRISNIGDDIREQNVTLQDFQYKMGLLDKKDIDLNRLISVLQVQHRKQESTLVEHTASLSGLARRARNHENSIRSVEELNQYFKQKSDQHTEQIDELKVEVGTLSGKVDRTEKTLLGKSAELAVLLKENVEATLETYASEITDWVSRQGQLELQVAEQNDTILSLEARTSRLQANSRDHSKDLQKLVPLSDDLRKDMNRARIDLIDLERSGKKAMSRVERHAEEISNLQDKTDQQGGMINDQATNINTLTLEQRNFRSAMNNRTADILDLRRQIQLLEAGDEGLRGGLQQVAFNLNQGMQAAQRATQRLEASMYNQTNTVYSIRTMTNSIRNELARKARQETRGERQLDLKMGLFQRTLAENTDSIREQRVKSDDQERHILRQSDVLQKLQGSTSQFQSKIGNQSVWLQKIQSKTDQLSSTFENLRKQFNGVDLKAERVQQGLNNQTVALQQFEFRLSDIESSSVDDGGVANQLNAKILALKSSIAQDLQEIQSQVEEIQSNAGDLRTLVGMHQRLKLEVRQVNQLFTQQRGTIGRIIQKNQQLERQIETQDESMTEMDTILYRLEQDMEQLKRDARRRPSPPQAEQSRSIDTETDTELDSSQDQPPSSTLSLEQVVDLLRRGRRSTGGDPDSQTTSLTESWEKMNDSIADLLQNHQQDLTEVVDAMKLFRTQAESLMDKDEKLERLYESLAKKVATLVAVQKKREGTMGNRALSRQMFKMEASLHDTYDVIGRIDQQVITLDLTSVGSKI